MYDYLECESMHVYEYVCVRACVRACVPAYKYYYPNLFVFIENGLRICNHDVLNFYIELYSHNHRFGSGQLC